MMNDREQTQHCRELAAAIREAGYHHADLGRQIIDQGERVDQSRFQMIEIDTELANLDRAQAPTTAIARIGWVAASVAAALALEATKARLRARLANAKEALRHERWKLDDLIKERSVTNQQMQRALSQFESSNCRIYAARP
jgi:hypothetical protein